MYLRTSLSFFLKIMYVSKFKLKCLIRHVCATNIFFSQLHFKVRALPVYLIFWKIFLVSFDITYVNVYQIKREGIIQLKEQNLFWKQNTILPINNFPSNEILLLTKREDLTSNTVYVYGICICMWRLCDGLLGTFQV